MNIKSFHEVSKNLPPTPFLLKTLSLPNLVKGSVLELGCGSGRDTVELLKQGWNVIAVDKSEEGISNLKKIVPENGTIDCRLESFEEMSLSSHLFDLVYSRYSLSFCQRESWISVWNKIVNSMKKGSFISMHLFGVNDGFKDSKRHGSMTFFSKEDVKELLVGFEVIFNHEEEDDKESAVGQMKHWHVFTIVAKKL